MEYGHWELLCTECEHWESFVYEIIDEYDKRYIGSKTNVKGWEKYISSSKSLKQAINNGLKCRYTILKFFGTAQEGFDYEDELLLKYNCVKSELYWNKSRRGKDFNALGAIVSANTRAKRSSENHYRFKGWYVIDGVQYATAKEAAADMKCSQATILNRIRSKNFPEYTFLKAPERKLSDKKCDQTGENNPNFKGWYVINGVKYASAGSAATAMKCSVPAILRRINSENFPEYVFLEAKTLTQKPKRSFKEKYQKGEKNPNFKGWYVIHGSTYSSLKDAANVMKCSIQTISKRTKSENFPEYIFVKKSMPE